MVSGEDNSHIGPHAQPPQCPLCTAQMTERTADPLRRAMGLALIYAAALTFTAALPNLGWGSAAGTILLAAYGCALARNVQTWWCPQCWFETKAGPPACAGKV